MRARRGFTLTELLVVIGILLALTVMVIAVYRASAGGDRMRSAARVAQSAILGARDRALHAGAIRGIRVLRDPQDQTIGIGLAYLQPIEIQTYGPQSIQLERPDWNGDNDLLDAGEQDVVIVRGFLPPDAAPHTDWHTLTDFFSFPPKIRIPAGTGQWYTFFWQTSAPYALDSTSQYLILTTPYVDPGVPAVPIAHPRSSGNSTCDIELAAELLPNHAPINLPSGVVLDLVHSPNVAAWWPLGPPTTPMDIMFTPRGTVHGPLAGLGPIHLLLRDIQDVTEQIDPLNVSPGVTHREELVLTIFPQTGHVQTFPVDQTDSNNDGLADDLFRFARTGNKAGN